MPRSPSLFALAFAGMSLAAGLAGCVPPKDSNSPTDSKNKDKGKITKNEKGENEICHQEYPTGSHIGRTVCRPLDQQERDRLEAQQELSRPRSNPTGTIPGGN
jgi:hypothetical protein